MGKKTRFALVLSGILALSVSTGTTLANTSHTDAIKKITDLQKEVQLEEGVLKPSDVQQLETKLLEGFSIQHNPFSEVNATAVNKASSDYLWEQEPNDDFDFANQLSYSKGTIGQLLPYYDMDFYKVKVPSDGMLAVGGMTSSYNIDLLFVATEKGFKDTGKLEYIGGEYDYDLDLEIQVYQAKAGTYYVPVMDADDYSNSSSDLYMITTSFLDNVAPAKPTINTIDDNDTAISGKAEANSTVTVKNGSKVIATTKATASGTFSAKIAVQKAGVKLTVMAEDSTKNKSAAATVTVVDKTAPAKPIVNKIDNNDIAITGKAEANSTVTIKNGSKVVATTKATATGTFSVKIAVQKAGAKLTVNAKDQAGNVSSSVSVTVVDVVAPATPTINKITVKDLKVTGKAEANSTVTAKAGKVTLGSAKADAKGNYSVKIKSQKAGVTIEVTAKDKAGNVSKKTTKVVVKK